MSNSAKNPEIEEEVLPTDEASPSNYTARIVEAKKEFSLPDNSSYLDIRFNIMLDDKAVAERRLAFPMGTTEEAIVKELKAYCQMFRQDHALAAEAAKRSEAEAEAESVLSNLNGLEV